MHLLVSLFFQDFLFLVNQIYVISRAFHERLGVVVMATVMQTELM